MTLHLVKLCVGVSKIAELEIGQKRQQKRYGKIFHTTRMMPKRTAELLDGGSLYWVIKGKICVRQSFLDVERVTDGEGKNRCRLHLAAEWVLTRPQGKRPFQGWRYFLPEDAPPDLPMGAGDADLPESLRQELDALGLI